jgi:hypothetical protein
MYLQKVISKHLCKITLWHLQPLTKKAGSGSGSLSQWYISVDPDPYQNVTDRQHCVSPNVTVIVTVIIILPVMILVTVRFAQKQHL